jgi:hypothetical protein
MSGKERKDLEAAMGITLKKILDATKVVGFSGRCWGTGDSFYRGSHVTLGEGDEVASVFVEDSKIRIVEYRKTTETALGKKVRAILEAKNLPLAK